MTQIYQLSEASELALGDLLPAYIREDGDQRKVSLSTLLAFLEANLSRGVLTTQYAAPSATGFSVTVESNTHLILTPVATYAAGTIVLPATPTDRDEFLCNTTQEVTTLTINGSGKTVTGAPTTLAANAYFRLKYDGVLSVWYRVA